MSTLIPNIQWEEIKAMTPEQLRLMRSCEVFDGDVNEDENYIYTHISRNPYDMIVADNKRIRAEQLGMSSNSIYPPDEPIQEAETAPLYVSDKPPKPKRKRRKLKVKV